MSRGKTGDGRGLSPRPRRRSSAIGRGGATDPAGTVEGAKTALSADRLARRHGIDMPITGVVAGLVEGRLTVSEALGALLARPLRPET